MVVLVAQDGARGIATVSTSIPPREPSSTTVPPTRWPDLLSRVLANRGVADNQSLGTCLAQMMPVGVLAGVTEAAQLLLRHRDGGLVLIVGDVVGRDLDPLVAGATSEPVEGPPERWLVGSGRPVEVVLERL